MGAPSERVLGFIVSLRPFCYDRERRRSRRNRGAYSVPAKVVGPDCNTYTLYSHLCFLFFLTLIFFSFSLCFFFFSPNTKNARSISAWADNSVAAYICCGRAAGFLCGESIWAFFLAMFWAYVAPIFCYCPCPHFPLFLRFPRFLKAFLYAALFLFMGTLNEIAYLPKPMFKWLLARRGVF